MAIMRCTTLTKLQHSKKTAVTFQFVRITANLQWKNVRLNRSSLMIFLLGVGDQRHLSSCMKSKLLSFEQSFH